MRVDDDAVSTERKHEPRRPVELNASASVYASASADATVVANFAWQHLKAATLFRDQTVAIENEHRGEDFSSFFEEIRSYASSCLAASVASAEALINELFIAHNTRLRGRLSDFDAQFWGRSGIERRPILTKYRDALDLLGAPRLDENSSPTREMRALIAFRNLLVHFKPIWDQDRPERLDLYRELQGRFALSPFTNFNSDFFVQQCMSGGFAGWVVSSTLAFMREFDARTNLDPGKMQSFWMLDCTPPGVHSRTT